MSEQTVVAIISGLVAVLVTVISKVDIFSRRHANIAKDIELYNSLPSDSKSKQKLLLAIDAKITSQLIHEVELRRNPAGIILGITLVLAGAYLSWFFYDKGSWWLLGWSVSFFILILGIVGFFQDISRLARDEKGNPIKSKVKKQKTI